MYALRAGFVVLAVCLGLTGAAADPAPAAPAVTLTLASSWNRRQNFTADFMAYVDAVNAAGKGALQIDFLGGPEVIPEQQLLYALRRGVIDLAFGGMTYYRGVLPEGDAMFGATIDPDEALASGALGALQPYWAKRINAHLVGWVQSGVGANVWLRDPPRFDPDGLPDLRGLIIRTSPSNRELLLALGARPVQIPVSDIYTALERRMVDGLAFTTIGLPDLGVGEFIHYRIDPPVLKLAVCLQINLDTWNRLSPWARQILEEQAVAYEHGNRARFRALQARELALLEGQGLNSAPVAAAQVERFRRLALDVVWTRLAKRTPDSAARLKPLFYPASTLPGHGR